MFKMKHKEVRKQLCLNTMSPNDALQFAVVKERGERSSIETSLTRGDRTPTERISKATLKENQTHVTIVEIG